MPRAPVYTAENGSRTARPARKYACSGEIAAQNPMTQIVTLIE